jgi:uncharacterized membrane protein YccC
VTGAFTALSKWSREAWGVLVGSDPGLLRLRLGVRAVLALALIIGAENLLAPRIGIPTVVAILLGGMIAMNGSFAASSRPQRDAAVTLAYFPVAAGVGALAGCLVGGHRIAGLVVFVVVMVGAVFVRRFGPRGFQYGMIAWLAYFFTMFVGFRIGQFGDVLAVIFSAAGCVAIAAVLLVPDRPDAAYQAARRAFDVRVAQLAETARDAVAGEIPADRLRRVLHARSFRVVEAALIIDGHLPKVAAGNQDQAAALIRRGLLDVELAAEELASAAAAIAVVDDLPPPQHRELVAALDALGHSDFPAARAHVSALTKLNSQLPEHLPITLARRLRDATFALEQLLRGLGQCGNDTAPGHVPAHVATFTPAVELFLGNLPSTAPTATAVISGGTSWWSRRSLNTRLCLQVAVAGTLAVAAGDLLSGRRYYWAVLACFLALTGTFTTGEIAVKGFNRLIGTIAGLLAATVTVHLTGHDDTAIVAVVLVCVFVGLYFFRISYALMAFAVTTVMGQLYNVLHEFSDRLLALRVAETALGAAIGVGVALVLLPIRTSDARGSAIDAFLGELATAAGEVRDRLLTGQRSSDLLLTARRVDVRLHQLALVVLPAGGQSLVGLSGRRASMRLIPFTEVAYSTRALAAAVGDWSVRGGPEHDPRRGEELGNRLVPLCRQLGNLHASAGLERVTAVLAQVSDEMRLLRRELEQEIHTLRSNPNALGAGARVSSRLGESLR